MDIDIANSPTGMLSLHRRKRGAKKKKTVNETVGNIEPPSFPNPTVLQLIYFLNPQKYISIGYDLKQNFRPVLTFNALSTSFPTTFTTFYVSDFVWFGWVNSNIENWFLSGATVAENVLHRSQHIKITPLEVNQTRYILLENLQVKRPNRSVLLSEDEYHRCLELSEYLQMILQTMEQNYGFVKDYFETYVVKCISQKKSSLTDNEFFHTSNPSTFDCYRLFREIPLFCKEKLEIDIEKMEKSLKKRALHVKSIV